MRPRDSTNHIVRYGSKVMDLQTLSLLLHECRNRNKIRAIKILREVYKISISEAKGWLEANTELWDSNGGRPINPDPLAAGIKE